MREVNDCVCVCHLTLLSQRPELLDDRGQSRLLFRYHRVQFLHLESERDRERETETEAESGTDCRKWIIDDQSESKTSISGSSRMCEP